MQKQDEKVSPEAFFCGSLRKYIEAPALYVLIGLLKGSVTMASMQQEVKPRGALNQRLTGLVFGRGRSWTLGSSSKSVSNQTAILVPDKNS